MGWNLCSGPDLAGPSTKVWQRSGHSPHHGTVSLPHYDVSMLVDIVLVCWWSQSWYILHPRVKQAIENCCFAKFSRGISEKNHLYYVPCDFLFSRWQFFHLILGQTLGRLATWEWPAFRAATRFEDLCEISLVQISTEISGYIHVPRHEIQGLSSYLEWLLPGCVYWCCWACGLSFLHQPHCGMGAGQRDALESGVSRRQNSIQNSGCLKSYTFLRP